MVIAAISPVQLAARLAAGEFLHLIDVRDPIEFDYCHLPGSVLVPLDELPQRTADVPANGEVVLVCHHGVRSAQAISYLQQRHGRHNLLNLRGGIDAWSREVDPTLPKY
ncbi:rhodanese-like domain-containing protein [Hymenobacter caeli]|uniref:Rhodanese-related sulfurtransferase n=1 Tax=Hymenobacter caeli TaxID=2735894 RepID=A0ABX2FX01_9BACT|nr:rhodanese-like domain-containing protein [Hymenobacter caeli]NRT20809.1 rhodanese-related sulfurtransferase [Hymenobacter caeli]